MADGEPGDHLVHEAVGPALTGVEAGVCIALGVNSLLVLGVVPVLLGDLVRAGRLTAAGIGLTAMTELLTMGVTIALAAMALKPVRLKAIGVVLCLALAAVDLAGVSASGVAIMVLRGVAGALEGLLLWITVGMIARTVTPERWAGVFFTAQVLAQLLLALAFAVWILPRFGPSGGFVAIALASLATAPAALFGPSRLADLATEPGQGGAPPLRGWIALFATLIYVSAGGAVGVYLEPLADQAGLAADTPHTAIWVSLVGQVLGGASATLVSGRVRYFAVFLVVTAVTLAGWWTFGHTASATVFIAANFMLGLSSIFLAPFLVPMTIDADPSRRAAVQSAGAQLLGGALGPWLASFVVGDRDVRGALWLGAGLLLAGLAVVAWLRLTHREPVMAAEAQ
ncbi:MFS transporter [Caulobacter sp. KR2-114]|uniref:MFS transporter n=1 Tax=Caulobacter sp. KR2-114 TaxID=3400912 RepID=UPI003C0FCE29